MKLGFLAIALTLGCANTTTAVRPLTVYPVEWNAQKVPLGSVAAIAEAGDEVTVFGDLGALTFAGGALVSTDGSVREWRTAATIPAADGSGTWMVGVDAKGRLHRVRSHASLEPVSGRFGLEKSDVHTIVDLGRGRVAFTLGDAVAIADADRVARYDYPFNVIAGGDGRGAGLSKAGARVFDPFRGVDRTFALEGLSSIALSADGRVVVANERAIWSEDALGKLHVRYESEDAKLRGIAASSDNIWFADDAELGLLSPDSVSRTTGSTTSIRTLIGSPSGDVWAIDPQGGLQRFSTVRAAGAWQTAIAPIQARICGSCHGPSGTAGLDLSGAARWQAHRDAIKRRVVVEKTMPPPGHPLTPEDRDAIARWLVTP